jgi:hypothetical protein
MSNSDWWAKQLGGNRPRQTEVPTAPNPQVPYVPQQQQQHVQVNYDSNTDQLTTKAQSAKVHTRCPECNSGNYMKVGVQSNQNGVFDVMRCYDCGYPKTQSGSGAGLPAGSSGAPTQRAKQVGQSNGFNPNIIVDRIG